MMYSANGISSHGAAGEDRYPSEAARGSMQRPLEGGVGGVGAGGGMSRRKQARPIRLLDDDPVPTIAPIGK